MILDKIVDSIFISYVFSISYLQFSVSHVKHFDSFIFTSILLKYRYNYITINVKLLLIN